MEYVLETYSSGNLFGKYLIENHCGDICHEKILTKISCPKAIFLGEIPQDTAFILKILCERYATKQSVKGNTNFEWRYLPNKFQRKPLPKSIWKSLPTKKNPKRNLYDKNLKRKLSPQKNQTISLPTIMSKSSTKETLKRHSLKIKI